jgi:hypothetical protein
MRSCGLRALYGHGPSMARRSLHLNGRFADRLSRRLVANSIVSFGASGGAKQSCAPAAHGRLLMDERASATPHTGSRSVVPRQRQGSARSWRRWRQLRIWREAGRLRFLPRNLSRPQSGAPDGPERRVRVPASEQEQGLQAERDDGVQAAGRRPPRWCRIRRLCPLGVKHLRCSCAALQPWRPHRSCARCHGMANRLSPSGSSGASSAHPAEIKVLVPSPGRAKLARPRWLGLPAGAAVAATSAQKAERGRQGYRARAPAIREPRIATARVRSGLARRS